MKKCLLLMCMMLLSIATASAQSHTITRRSNNNNSTVSKPSPTRTPSSGKKATSSSSGKKTGGTTSSGKQSSSGRKTSTTATMETEEKPLASTIVPAPITNCPDSYHPHAIDLGLPSGTKWACCNVGAAKPEDYGGYYAWGETREKTTYDWSTYIHCNGSSSTCQNLGSDIAGTQYDVAHVKWGGAWVMPSEDQIKELLNNCTYTWTTRNGVEGGKFTGKNGRAIFLPAAGGCNNLGLGLVGSHGIYWSSTQLPSNSSYAYYLSFYSGYANWGNVYRDFGQVVRPVYR